MLFECVNNILFPKMRQIFLWWNVSYLIIFYYAYDYHYGIKLWKCFNTGRSTMNTQLVYYLDDNPRNLQKASKYSFGKVIQFVHRL